ncbi:MAG TPA: nickel pincer cofactor biosynthesis protein LarC [Syntrophaceae bacterium]|nr:nickel pincer cofactor biosynthesis protein LarC [Syntrophaceae bacterium]
MPIAYFDCFSGISGDMVLGALIDAGLSIKHLRAELKKLPLSGYTIKLSREERCGILGCKVRVGVHKGKQSPRSYLYIKELIQKSPLEERVRGIALKIFQKLARVEAGIHGCHVEKVYFHEIGATDSIIDIVGTAIGLVSLGISKVYASKIPVGRGFVTCSHGTLPVPTPATLALLKGIPIYCTGMEQELVTPTGAAIIATISQGFGEFPPMRPTSIGYGVGESDMPPIPNLLRIVLGEEQKGLLSQEVDVLETNIDDMNPMFHGYIMEKLFECGALDVSLLPIHMKKNRPGILLRVVSRREDRDRLMDILFRESTTLGVRCHQVERITAKRCLKKVKTPYGDIRVKVAVDPSGSTRFLPEYEDCRCIAKKKDIPLKEIYHEAIVFAKKMFEKCS